MYYGAHREGGMFNRGQRKKKQYYGSKAKKGLAECTEHSYNCSKKCFSVVNAAAMQSCSVNKRKWLLEEFELGSPVKSFTLELFIRHFITVIQNCSVALDRT